MTETLWQVISKWPHQAMFGVIDTGATGKDYIPLSPSCAPFCYRCQIERWAHTLAAPRQWMITGGGGHEDGEDGIRAMRASGEYVVEMLEAYSEYVLGLPKEGEEGRDEK